MKVETVYRPAAAYVTPADSLRDAAQRMRKSGQGCLPVLDGSQVVGIVTERDLAAAVAKGVVPATAHVIDYSSDGSVTVSLDDETEVAEAKMLAIGCRNLPVVDQDRLVGTVTLLDLFANLHGAPPPLVTAGRSAAADRWPEEPPPDVDSER